MKKSLHHWHISRLLALYDKLNQRLQRHFELGRFQKLGRRKQYQLLQRLEKLKAKLNRLLAMGKGLATGTALLATVSAAEAQIIPIGEEFRVNTYTTNIQRGQSIAIDSDGDFVITWQSRNQDGSGDGIYAQRYNSTGVAQGAEFRVNTYTTGFQNSPAIAMDSDGDFIITWNSDRQVDDWDPGIYAQRYNSAGIAQGGEFRVNTNSTKGKWPSIAMDSDGDFVITWVSNQDGGWYGIYAQRYNAAGVAQGAEFRVNTYTTDVQRNPSIAMESNGDFVITWESFGQDGMGYGIYAQRYNAAGGTLGAEFRVNTYTVSYQFSPSVAMDSDGDFVITWQSRNQDGSIYGIYAQRYNPIGVAEGTEFKVNTFTTYSQIRPSIAMDSEGDFVISWESQYQDDELSYGIYAQHFNAAGVAQGGEFRVNTFTTFMQTSSSVAMDSDGEIVITWQSYTQD